jgi:3-hydroxyisobutyrate dehydrogenase-like beta-hydroxyacid dehydrogenase
MPIVDLPANETTDAVGLLGVGLAGSAIARRLIAAHYQVRAFDPAPSASERVRELGAHWLESERDVARDCRSIVLSLPGPVEVRSVIDVISCELRAGDMVIDTTTGSPDAVEAIAECLLQKEVHYLDATLGGSSRQIANGEAIVICGAEEQAFARAEPLLRCLGSSVFHTGPPGSGTRMKLVLNLALGLQRAVLAEALEFARHSGIDPARALAILRSGPAYAKVMDIKGEKMLYGAAEPEARLAQHWKDVRLMLECADRNGAFVPLTRLHDQLLASAVDSGWGAEDNSAIIRVFRGKSS